MKASTKSKKVDGCSVSMEVEISKEDVADAAEHVCGEFVRSAEIQGFRAGKAPRDMVMKRYKKEIDAETIKGLVRDSFRSIFEEHKIRPVVLPEVTGAVFTGGGALRFNMKVDLMPDMKLKDYRSLRLVRKRVDFKEEDAQKALESLRAMNAKYVSVEGRPVSMGDYTVSDLECLVEGKPVHRKRENFWIFVDRESPLPALCERMVGMNKGDEKDCDIAMPENYSDKRLAGKNAVYRVKVKEIKERVLPQLDDEFARDLGKDSLTNLKEGLREALLKRMEEEAASSLKECLLNKILDMNQFDVPASLVERQIGYLLSRNEEDLVKRGVKREDIKSREKEFVGKFRQEAVRRVRLFFILGEISRIENIGCAYSDLEEALKAIAGQTEETAETVKAYYEKEDLVDDLKAQIKEEKTIKFLLEKADIKEE